MIDRSVIDGEARHGPHGSGPDVEHPDAFAIKGFDEFQRCATGRVDIEVDDVRLDRIEFNREARTLIDGFCEAACTFVIFRETIDMVVERMNARGGQESGLAHGSSVHLPEAMHACHRRGIACDHGACRGTKSLRETDGDRVEAGADGSRRFARGNRGVPHASAIEVAPEAM